MTSFIPIENYEQSIFFVPGSYIVLNAYSTLCKKKNTLVILTL